MNLIKYVPLSLFVSIGLKSLILGGSYESAVALLITGAVAAYYETKSQDKAVKELSDKVASLDAKLEETTKTIKNVDTHLQSFKLASGSRQLNRV